MSDSRVSNDTPDAIHERTLERYTSSDPGSIKMAKRGARCVLCGRSATHRVQVHQINDPTPREPTSDELACDQHVRSVEEEARLSALRLNTGTEVYAPTTSLLQP